MKTTLLIFTLLTCAIQPQLFGATSERLHEIFLDDSMYVDFNTTFTRLGDNEINIGFDFRQKLPGGKWILYDIKRADSKMLDLSQHVFAIGSFNTDSLRHGLFEYRFTAVKEKNSMVSLVQVTYRFGKLDGFCSARNEGGLTYLSGNYFKGQREGLFTNGVLGSNSLTSIELYEHDTLLSWWRYIDGILYSTSTLNDTGLRTIHLIHNGATLIIGYLDQQKLIKYEVFDTLGYKKIESFGDFGAVSVKTEDDLRAICKQRAVPVSGMFIIYNEEGNMIREDVYKSGILQR